MISQLEHSFLPDFLVDERCDHIFAIVDDLEQWHVELHLLEAVTLLVDALHSLEVLNDGIVLGKRDVLNVYHHFVERNVILAAEFKLHLHGSHQNHVDSFVFDVKFSLLAVEPVQNVLQITDFWQVGSEVVQQTLVVHFHSIWSSLVDMLCILQQAPFLHFFISKQLLE